MRCTVLMRCAKCRKTVSKRRPVGLVRKIRGMVRVMGLRCRVCDGRTVVKVVRVAVRLPKVK